jgi:hypothetical protein
MNFFFVTKQNEWLTKLGMEFTRAVTRDWQPTTFSWAVFSKCSNDYKPTWFYRVQHLAYISLTFVVGGQEVENSTIMPN